MTDRFDLEQEIMACWSVVDDMRKVAKVKCDVQSFEALATIYDIKFNSLFAKFEEMVKAGKIT